MLAVRSEALTVVVFAHSTVTISVALILQMVPVAAARLVLFENTPNTEVVALDDPDIGANDQG
jgi:hypothetical protein